MAKADLDKAFKELVEVEQLLDSELTVESATQISNLFQSLKIRMKQLIEKPQVPVDADYDNKCKEFSLRMKTGLVKFKELATKITNANKPAAIPIEPKAADPIPEPRVIPALSRAASEVNITASNSTTSSANTSKRNSMQLDATELNNGALNESGSALQPATLSAQSNVNPKLDAPPSPSKSRVFKMKGYLKKQGEKGLKSWRRRYFRLVGNSLAYYHDNGDERPINSIDLTQMTTAKVMEGQSFDIETSTRVWHLEAESTADARHWVNALLLWKKNWERPQIKPVSAESVSAPLDEEVVPEVPEDIENESESARREREAREQERARKREERLRREAERQAERERREQERRERELRDQAESETTTTHSQDTSLRSSVDSLESTSGASTSSKEKKKDKKGFFGFMKRNKGADVFPENLNLLGQEVNVRDTKNEERRDSIAPVIIHDYRGEQREGGEEVPVIVTKPKTREQIEQERAELLQTREEQIKRKEQLLEQLKKELPGLEAQRREQERLEREAEAQNPEMIALNEAVNEQEHEIQLYATTQDIYDQEIQQQKHKFDELFKQETKLEHELSQLHQELRVTEAKLREVRQESEMAASEALRLDGEVQSLKEAREARNSTDDPRVLIAELRRAIRTQKEAQEAHLAQAEFLSDELQRVQATCTSELEEMNEKVDTALRQFKLRRARLQDLRASSLNQVSLADELEAIRKDYFCSLVLGSKLTASIQRQPLGTSMSATAMYDRALEENVPVNAWPSWIADKFSV